MTTNLIDQITLGNAYTLGNTKKNKCINAWDWEIDMFPTYSEDYRKIIQDLSSNKIDKVYNNT